MPLGLIIKTPPVVWLVPTSGIQFIDFGFTLARSKELPTQWSFYDDPKASPVPLIVGRAGADPTGRVTYDVDWRKIVEMLDRVWVPVPFFRREKGGGYQQGPVNWARAYVAWLEAPDEHGYDHRVVLAFDTDLSPRSASSAYLAPAPEDAQRGAEFALAANAEQLGWFVGLEWVRNWARASFVDMIVREERARARSEPVVDDAVLANRMEGPREDLARLMALIELLRALDVFPGIRFVDRYTKPTPTPIEVDLVLDVGNSRTCGLLVEADPGGRGVDIGLAFKLALRDLSQPEQVYDDPFESRLEFALARFGSTNFAAAGGRSDAFTWPTIVRVGPEAMRLPGCGAAARAALACRARSGICGTRTKARQPWHFNGLTMDGEWGGLAAQGQFATLVNDIGQPLHLVAPEDEDGSLPSLLAKYSRSHLMTFALAEVLQQALTMMNSPAQRLRGGRSADLPRRLRRLVLTLPAALPITERQLLKERAEAARDLVYLCSGRAARIPGEPALTGSGSRSRRSSSNGMRRARPSSSIYTHRSPWHSRATRARSSAR